MKLWIITAFMLFTGISLSAQMRYGGHVYHDRSHDNNHFGNDYNSYAYNHNSHWDKRKRKADKVLEKLYRKHHKSHSKAMRDGFIDRNETRKLKRIEGDIYHLERNLNQRHRLRTNQHRRMHCQ